MNWFKTSSLHELFSCKGIACFLIIQCNSLRHTVLCITSVCLSLVWSVAILSSKLCPDMGLSQTHIHDHAKTLWCGRLCTSAWFSKQMSLMRVVELKQVEYQKSKDFRITQQKLFWEVIWGTLSSAMMVTSSARTAGLNRRTKMVSCC